MVLLMPLLLFSFFMQFPAYEAHVWPPDIKTFIGKRIILVTRQDVNIE